MKNQVSLCMIVKDEEEYLENCLSSIYDMVDEIIVVDTGSNDKTVDIAKNFGAKIYYKKWNNNFSEARNESLKYATKDWILILDADDEFSLESRENFKTFINMELDEKGIYYFETLSYYGHTIEDGNVAINLNPRLFRNYRGVHYEGEIHNQLIFTKDEFKVIIDTVKIYHFGYLDKRIISRDKRNRNITILNEQIKNNPMNEFAYFNLGNEYAAVDDMNKALEYYYKAYESFNANMGYGYILILRIIVSNYNIGKYNEALKFIEIGLENYPKCTDFYFYESLIWKEIRRVTLQIRALEKCIELGEPPSEFKFIFGTGSFRAYYELGNVYAKYEDYDTAYNYYVEALRLKADYIQPLYNIAKILKVKNVSLSEFKRIIEEFVSDEQNNKDITIADIFFNIGDYDIALEYINHFEDEEIISEETSILKLRCLLRTSKFEEYTKIEISKESSNYVELSMYKVLCFILLNNFEEASDIINSFNENEFMDSNKKYLTVYSELVKLFIKEPTTMLSNDKDTEYMTIILDILELLLVNNKINEFEVAVNLLNLVENRYALLNLGKLYFKYGYIDIAKKEVLRSIKEFDVYDNEGLDILKY